MFGLLPVLWLFWEYRSHFGHVISSNREDWSVFGSVLSGAFTYVAAIGAIFSLAILMQQQIENNKIANRLAVIQSFDEYEKHRATFFTLLDEISRQYEGEIYFPTRSKVYSSIFYMNSPDDTQHKINIIKDGTEQYRDLTDCVKHYEKLGAMFDDAANGREIVLEIADLNYLLGIKHKETKRGDILFHKVNTGVNIGSLDESLKIIESVLNVILKFTQNDPVRQIYQKAEGDVGARIKDDLLRSKSGVFELVQ